MLGTISDLICISLRRANTSASSNKSRQSILKSTDCFLSANARASAHDIEMVCFDDFQRCVSAMHDIRHEATLFESFLDKCCYFFLVFHNHYPHQWARRRFSDALSALVEIFNGSLGLRFASAQAVVRSHLRCLRSYASRLRNSQAARLSVKSAIIAMGQVLFRISIGGMFFKKTPLITTMMYRNGFA